VAICTLAFLLITTPACRKSPAVAEYDVLSAFIDAEFASRKGVHPVEPAGDGISRIVISNVTESDEQGVYARLDGNGQPIPGPQIASSLQKEDSTLQRTTIDAFREANKRQTPLRRSFHTSIDYELVDSTELQSIFKEGSWPAFYRRFPGSSGILTFSRVGFSSDGMQALFYVKNRCGELCGGSAYFVMEKRDDRWVIEKEIDMYVS
jgi:hypothetical protein